MESEWKALKAHPTIRLRTALACWMFSPPIGIASYIYAKSRLEQTQLLKPFSVTTASISEQDAEFVREAFLIVNQWGFCTLLVVAIACLIGFFPLTQFLPKREAIREVISFGVICWLLMNFGLFIAVAFCTSQVWRELWQFRPN